MTKPLVALSRRAERLFAQVPDDPAHKTVSRHHCLLDLNPPDIRVRDFGSLNGTYVNGKKIGQREKGMSPEEAANMAFPEHDLKHGDEIQVGDTVFRVSVFVPALCAECSDGDPRGHEVAGGAVAGRIPMRELPQESQVSPAQRTARRRRPRFASSVAGMSPPKSAKIARGISCVPAASRIPCKS